MCSITWRMTLSNLNSPALNQSVSSNSWKIAQKCVSRHISESTGSSTDLITRVWKLKCFPQRQDMCVTKALRKAGDISDSICRKAPFHRNPERIIERLIIYIVSTSVNSRHGLKSMDAKGWCGLIESTVLITRTGLSIIMAVSKFLRTAV